MRLHIISDLHTEKVAFEIPKVDADVLILGGDIVNAFAENFGQVTFGEVVARFEIASLAQVFCEKLAANAQTLLRE